MSAVSRREPDPSLVFETLTAFHRSAALQGAIELDLFSAIGEGNSTVAALASRCQASERGMRILCDYLSVLGFLSKQDERYQLTDVSALFLDRRSANYAGSIARFVHSPRIRAAFDNVAQLVRRGETLLEQDGLVEPENENWVEFARSMAPMMAPAAEFMAEVAVEGHAGKLTVLDIAAGHGLFGIAIARKNPEAQIVAVDWPNVLTVAKENAAAAGLGGRYRLLPGDAFDVDYEQGYDLVILANFLHHFGQTTCQKLLRKIHACLNPSGRALTLEFVPNEDRVTPPIPASFSFTMLATTPSGDAYTFRQYEDMFHAAGFEHNQIVDVPGSAHRLITAYR